MAALPTIVETIAIGDGTVSLMGNDVANGALFGARLVKPSTTVMIAYVTDAIRWQNEGQPADTTLRSTCNYLIWLCGIYGAQVRAGSGGGTVIPIQPSATPNRLDFYVSDTTPVKTGETTVVFLQFIGYNLDFYRGNLAQMTVSNGFDTYFSWDRTTGTFQCFGPANEGEPFSLLPYV